MEPLILPGTLHGLRLDKALSELFPQYSRTQWASWVKAQKVSVNGRWMQPKDKVYAADNINFHSSVGLREENIDIYPQAIPLDIVYEDKALLVVNKPAGLVVHPGAGIADGTLVNALAHHDNALLALPRAGIIHRLDKDTTGLLLVAKTVESYTILVRKMQERTINREYFALVQGCLNGHGDIKTYFGRHPKNRLKMAVTKAGKLAFTEYAAQKQYPYCSLVRVKLHTGRTHQIRVHMAYIHHPIIGDPLYGKKLVLKQNVDPNLKSTIEAFKRQALHAMDLSLMHPITEKLLTFHADLPQDFSYLLSILEIATREHDD